MTYWYTVRPQAARIRYISTIISLELDRSSCGNINECCHLPFSRDSTHTHTFAYTIESELHAVTSTVVCNDTMYTERVLQLCCPSSTSPSLQPPSQDRTSDRVYRLYYYYYYYYYYHVHVATTANGVGR